MDADRGSPTVGGHCPSVSGVKGGFNLPLLYRILDSMNQQWRQVLQYGLQPILNQYLFLFVVNFCSVGTKKKVSYHLYKGFSLEKNGFK